MNKLPDELQTELRAATETAIKPIFDAHFAPLIERKQQELQELELARQQAIESWLREKFGGNDSIQMPLVQETANSSHERPVARNGSHGTPTRRAMLFATLPDFNDSRFYRRDVEAKIFETWPQVKPKTKDESRNLTSGFAALMTDLVGKGLLESTEGENHFDPRTYQLTDKGKEALLKSGP